MSGLLVKCGDRFVETEIDDEVVVMDLDSGEFFSLSGTGLAIWRLIDGSRDRLAIVATLAAEYAVPESEITGDVDDFVGRLLAAGLVSGSPVAGG